MFCCLCQNKIYGSYGGLGVFSGMAERVTKCTIWNTFVRLESGYLRVKGKCGTNAKLLKFILKGVVLYLFILFSAIPENLKPSCEKSKSR